MMKKIACESTRIPCIDHSNMFRTLVYLFLRPSCTELNYIPIYSIQPPPRILAWYPIISSIIRACLSGPGVQFNFRVFFPAFFGILVWMYEPSSHLSIYLCVFSSICLFTIYPFFFLYSNLSIIWLYEIFLYLCIYLSIHVYDVYLCVSVVHLG